MSKSASTPAVTAAPVREPRPFLFLEPLRLPLREVELDPAGRRALDDALASAVPVLVRSLVDYSIAVQNRSMLERGNRQPIQLSVLNRRRRVARAWWNAILAGRTDAGTLHAVQHQWLPTLAATGPEQRVAPAVCRRFVEFVRGAATAWLFADLAENLLPHAKALHVLESVLAAHLTAAVQGTRAAR